MVESVRIQLGLHFVCSNGKHGDDQKRSVLRKLQLILELLSKHNAVNYYKADEYCQFDNVGSMQDR